MEEFSKNKHGWKATENDYRLIFKEDARGMWREITDNLPQYSGVLLADYLAEVEIVLPDGCQFCRVNRSGFRFEYRDNGGYIRIDVDIEQ